MTTQKHCSFPEIGQYRNVVKIIQDRARYVGRDKNGDAIFDNTKLAPKLTFVGTVKLHGTNAGISFDKDGNYWAQSRENIITPEQDNAGFAKFVEGSIDIFRNMVQDIPFNGYDYVTIFGEWCGQGIQKGVAISTLPKMFVIFDIKRSYEDETKGENLYADIEEISRFSAQSHEIYNIYDFKTYSVTIDFENPALYQNQLIELVTEVETECPVGKAFGSSGTGEGIVFRYKDPEGHVYRWKSKGEKHSSSKVKTLVPVDTEKVNSVIDFVEYAVTESRLEQGLEKTYGIGGYLDITKMGDFIRWIVNDIQKEESDTMEANGLTPKDVNSEISKKCRNWLMNKINSTF